MSPKSQLLLRLWVGGGFIAVGLWQAFSSHAYPPGDVRGTPGFWVILGGLAAFIGVGILLSSVWEFSYRLRELGAAVAAELPCGAQANKTTYDYGHLHRSGDGVRLSAATGTGAATTNVLVDRATGPLSVALERDGTGTLLRTALYGLGRISMINATGGIAYEHPDGLGSVTDLVSSSGVALGWTDYGPYGAVRSAGAMAGIPADPFGFTGAYLDGTTGLSHLRARQYDPATGRFLSTDPVALPITDPYVAAYLYANANPVRYTDPSGRCIQFLGAAAAGAITGPGEAVIAPVSLLGFVLCVGAAVWLPGATNGGRAGRCYRRYLSRLGDRGSGGQNEWLPRAALLRAGKHFWRLALERRVLGRPHEPSAWDEAYPLTPSTNAQTRGTNRLGRA